MSDPTPAPTPAPAPANANWFQQIYNELKTLALGMALGVALFGRIAPTPPAPIPPIPAPTPIPNPTPMPPPVPAWGPLTRIIVLYESSKLTGKEAFYAQPVRDALNQTAPADSTGTPSWRIWDKDMDVSREPEWADAFAKAKADFAAATAGIAGIFGGSSDPVLYAFDAAGKLKSIPLKGLSDADLVAKIKALGGK